MSNEKERNVIAALTEVESNEITTVVGFGRGADTVYTIKWVVPDSEEEAQARYNCSLRDLVTQGVRNLIARPDYQDAGFDENGELKEDGHKLMQELADNYRCNTRKAKAVNKTEEQKALESLCAAKGISLLDLIEKAKAL